MFVILFFRLLFLMLHHSLNNICMVILFRVSSNTYFTSKLILVPFLISFSIIVELFSFITFAFCVLVSIYFLFSNAFDGKYSKLAHPACTLPVSCVTGRQSFLKFVNGFYMELLVSLELLIKLLILLH